MTSPASTTRLLSDRAYQRIDLEIAKYPAEQRQSAVMAALVIAQDEKGWCSPEVIEEVGRVLQMPAIAVWEVATFYNMYNTQPVGRFKIAVCTNLPCQLRDGAKAGEYLKSQLGIDYNQTTADAMVTLKESECLGACGDAPVLLVNDKRMCSFMNNERLDALLAEIRAACAASAEQR